MKLSKCDGIDHIDDTINNDKSNTNILRFGAGVDSKNIKLGLGSLLLNIGNGDQVHIDNFNQNDVFNSVSIDSFEFADGTSLTSAELLARGFDLDGTAGNDTLIGTNTTDRINGYGGDDTLIGLGGTDTLMGGDGNDQLIGDADSIPLVEQGNDLLDGGAGDDALLGNGGNDTLKGRAANDYNYDLERSAA